MTSTYGERLYASLYSQSFQNANPRGWSLSPAAVTEALDVLAAKARDYAAKPSRETMIEQFRLAFPGERGNWLPGMGAEQEYATWLYDVAWDIATAPEQADDEPADVQTSGPPPYPEAPDPFTSFHPDVLTRLREWAEDGVDDVADGVDAQALALAYGAWVTDSCATSGEVKDFLGAVMRYKKARLDNARAMDSMPKRYRVIGESPSDNVNEAAPIGTLVQYAPEAGPIDSIIPCRVVRDTGGTIAGGGTGSAWWFRKENLEPAEWSLPQIGEFYTVVGDNPVASGYRHGDTVVIASLADCTYGRARWDVLRAGDPTGMFLHREHMSMQPVTPTPVQTSGLETVGEIIDSQVQPLQDEVTSLTAQVETLTQQLANAQAHHRNDLDIIARHFWENAHRRGWCSEAEDVINEINEETHLELETDREVYRPLQTFYPDIDVRFTARDDHGLEWVLNVTLEVEVEGRDKSDARENITSAVIIAKAKAIWPNLPDDLRVDEWDTA